MRDKSNFLSSISAKNPRTSRGRCRPTSYRGASANKAASAEPETLCMACFITRQTVDRGPAFSEQSAIPSRTICRGVVRRSSRSCPHTLAVRHRPQFKLHVQGKAADVKQLARAGRALRTRGVVRKAGSRVRSTGLSSTQQPCASMGGTFRGRARGLFDLQDQVTANVVGAIAPKLEQAEIERASANRPKSLDAYDYFCAAWRSCLSGQLDAKQQSAVAVLQGYRTRSQFCFGLRSRARCDASAQNCRLGNRSRKRDY